MSFSWAADHGLARVPSDVRTMLVFGGSFDPPHRGHVALPRQAMELVGADWVLYVPAARSPHKAEGPNASSADRAAMLEAALGESEDGEQVEAWASVCTVELSATPEGEPSYTVRTLGWLADRLPGVRLRLLIGADQALALHRWREPDRIMELAEPLVLLREPAESASDLVAGLGEAGWGESELGRWRARVVAVRTDDVSSSRVRGLLADSWREGLGELEGLVPSGVLRVIASRGLYRSPESSGGA